MTIGVRPMASVQFHATWAMYSTGAGLNADFYAHADAIADVGFEAVRIDLSWSESQPTQGTLPTASTQVIQRVTTAMNYMHSKGIKTFLTPWRAPNWAHPADTSSPNVFPDAAHIVDYQAWVTRITDLFGGNPALMGLEIWNEPDLGDMTGAGNDNAAAYAPVLAAAYDAVKASTFPDTKVVFGGPVAADWYYIENVINAVQAAHSGQFKYDIMAYHPYQGNWKHRFDSYDYSGVTRDANNAWTQFRAAGGINGVTWTGSAYVPDANSPNSLMGYRRRKSDSRPMWATEWGTSRATDSATVAANRSITTEGVPGTWATVDDKWADYYVQAFEWLKNNNAATTLLNCYTAFRPNSPDAGGSLSTDGMRLLNSNGTLTAAATALKTYFAANPTHRDPFASDAASSALPVHRTTTQVTNDSASPTTTGSIAGMQDGDLMVAMFVSSDTVTGAALTAVPAGWTVLRAHTSNGTMSSWYGYRIKQAGDTNPVWTLAAARDTQVLIWSASGVAASNPIDVSAFGTRAASQTTTDAPPVTTTGANRLIVRLLGEKSSTSTSATDPAGHTRRAAAWGSGASTTSGIALETSQVTAGTVAAATETYNVASANGIAATIAVNPVVTTDGTANLSATSNMTVTGVRTALGSAALSASSDLTASGTVSSVVAALSASSDLTATGVKSTTGTAALSASSDLTVDGTVTRPQPTTPDGTHPSRIFVAGTARVYLGRVGTPAPLHPAAVYDAALREVGLFRRDSLKFRIESTFESYKGHQSDYPEIDLETERTETLELNLQEWSGENFLATWAGGEIVEVSAGVWRFNPPQVGQQREPVMCVVRVIDGSRTYALVIPKCTVLEGIEYDFAPDSESVLPLRLTIRQPDSGFPWWFLSDDDEAWRPIIASSFLSYPGGNVYPSADLYPQDPAT